MYLSILSSMGSLWQRQVCCKPSKNMKLTESSSDFLGLTISTLLQYCLNSHLKDSLLLQTPYYYRQRLHPSQNYNYGNNPHYYGNTMEAWCTCTCSPRLKFFSLITMDNLHILNDTICYSAVLECLSKCVQQIDRNWTSWKSILINWVIFITPHYCSLLLFWTPNDGPEVVKI